VRVVGGTKKGKRLASVVHDKTRPTSDRVREAIFNVLGQTLPAANVLDVCAGTGAMGLEAISRGAAKAVFIDSASEAFEIIKENAAGLGFTAMARVIKEDAVKAVRKLGKEGLKFQLVFVDAPYADVELTKNVLAELKTSGVLDEALIVCEVAKRSVEDVDTPGYVVETEKTYGDTVVLFLREN